MSEDVQLRRIARFAYGDALAEIVRRDGSIPVVSSGGITGSHAEANVRGPSIVVGRKGSFGSVHWMEGDCFVIDTAYSVVPASPGIDIRWLYYRLLATDLRGLTQDVGVPGLSRESAYMTRVMPPPNYDEQRRIADFLDTETGRIDKLLAFMDRQIETLEQRRPSSLAERLAYPESSSVRLGYRTNIVTSGPRGWGEYVGDRGTPFFRSANLQRNSIEPNLMEFARVSPPFDSAEARRSRINEGDVLIGITGANTGWVGLSDQSVVGANVSQHVCLIRPGRELDPSWLAYLLSAPAVQESLLGMQYGGTKTQLSLPDIRNIRIPIVSRAEQVADSSVISSELNTLRRQLDLRLRQQSVVRERRQALIAMAITGQLDVTTARGADLS